MRIARACLGLASLLSACGAAGTPEWRPIEGRYCAHCSGGEQIDLAAERVVGGALERVVVTTEQCTPGAGRATVVVGPVRDGVIEPERIRAWDVPIEIVECSPDGPLHVRLSTTLDGERLALELRVETPARSAGYE